MSGRKAKAARRVERVEEAEPELKKTEEPREEKVFEQIEPGVPYTFDLRDFWYSDKPFPVQERFVFEAHSDDGCPMHQGLCGGRGLGKTKGFGRKLLVLALLNSSGDPQNPVWGAIFGRDLKEVHQKLLPPLLADIADIKRRTGIDWTPRIVKGEQVLHFPFGTSVYLLSYSKRDQLEKARGYNLAFAGFDEVELSGIAAEDILGIITPAIRDERAKHKCLFWTSTPNGLRGFVKVHHDAYEAGDPEYWLVTGTSYDNPYQSRAEIRRRTSRLSKRLYLQEYLGVVLQPLNVVFGEYSESRHLVRYRWSPYDKTIIGVDWGTSHAYICAIKVDDGGRWVVAKERKVVDTTPVRFRRDVVAFVDEVRRLDGGRSAYLMTCDPAVDSEKRWLVAKYSSECEAGVLCLEKTAERSVLWGLHLMSSMLDPIEEAPRLLVSDELPATTSDAEMGFRGALATYAYAQIRNDMGELITTNEPSKKNNADHPIDTVRYLVCVSRYMEELHGGQAMAFIDPEQY